jgi:hypothetical protein
MRKEIWDQLKNITSSELLQAFIHNHPHKNFGAKQLKELLKDIGWEENDLKRLKLIK